MVRIFYERMQERTSACIDALCTSFLLRMKQLPRLEDASSERWPRTKTLRDIFLSYLESFAYHMRLLETELGDADEDLMEFLDDIFLDQSLEAYHSWLCCLEYSFCNRLLRSRYTRGSVVASCRSIRPPLLCQASVGSRHQSGQGPRIDVSSSSICPLPSVITSDW